MFGRLSDSIGRTPLALVFSFGGAVAIVPLALALNDSWVSALFIDLAFLALTACVFSVLAAVMAERFPARMRASGIGIPYNVALSLFGGTAPFLLTWFASMGNESWYFVYLAALAFLVSLGFLGVARRGHYH